MAIPVGEHHLGVQRACRLAGLSRAAHYTPLYPAPERDVPVIAAPQAMVAERGRWGFWRCFCRLREFGHACNHKRVHRVYCALRLNLPPCTKRRLPTRVRHPLEASPVLNGIRPLDSGGGPLGATGGSARPRRCRATTASSSSCRGSPVWYAERGITLRHIQTRRPDQNALVEPFNRT